MHDKWEEQNLKCHFLSRFQTSISKGRGDQLVFIEQTNTWKDGRAGWSSAMAQVHYKG